ncbi:hypothetical protein CR513_08989, partial [Mucuna pruriens]
METGLLRTQIEESQEANITSVEQFGKEFEDYNPKGIFHGFPHSRALMSPKEPIVHAWHDSLLDKADGEGSLKENFVFPKPWRCFCGTFGGFLILPFDLGGTWGTKELNLMSNSLQRGEDEVNLLEDDLNPKGEEWTRG